MVVSDECAQIVQQGFCILYVHRPRQGGFQQRDELAGEGFVFECRRNDGCANDDLAPGVFGALFGLEPLNSVLGLCDLLVDGAGHEDCEVLFWMLW